MTEVGPEERVRVNCGLQHPISLVVPSERTIHEGEHVTVRITSRRPVRAQLVDVPSPGPRVACEDLLTALEREDAGLRVATSRRGDPLTVDGLSQFVQRIQVDGTTIVFGAPQRALPEIVVDHPKLGDPSPPSVEPSSRFDLWLNAIPNQGTETVRTEDAMFAVLGCLSLKE